MLFSSLSLVLCFFFFFFFQAEDGIRDGTVTGVQTCALPISGLAARLRGMFAFALVDEKAHELYAARDRFGKKPFHWLVHGGTFAFASEQIGRASCRERV